MNTAARMKVNWTSIVNIPWARSRSPSPIVLATSADPPVPTIRPSAPMSMIAGQMTLSAAKAVVPTKFDTNSPSTTL